MGPQEAPAGTGHPTGTPSTSMALSHQFIWSSTSLILCFMRSGGSSLAWPTTAGDRRKQETQDVVGLCERIPTFWCGSHQIPPGPDLRSMAAGAAVPMPRFWIWYTGCVGLCPSFSPLGGAGAAGGGGAVPSGVEAFAAATGPFPSSRGFMRTMGFSSGAGAAGAAGAAGGGGCFDCGSEKVPVTGRDPRPNCSHPPLLKNASLLTRSAGGFERMMGVFCMTEVLVSSLPSCGERGQSLRKGPLASGDPPEGSFVPATVLNAFSPTCKPVILLTPFYK